MRSRSSYTLIYLCLFALFFSMMAASLSIFSGPQISHIINCLGICLIIYVIFKVFKSYQQNSINSLQKDYQILVLFALILIELLFAYFLISIHYGYTNWDYRYLVILNPPF